MSKSIKQEGVNDCGIFAIAAATALAFGSAPVQLQQSLVYRAIPRVVLLSHALNYKRVWRGGREGLAEVISIHSHNTHLTTTTRYYRRAQVRATTRILHSDLIGQRLMNTNDFC